nr:821_t:CDS:2 [Entrophospora candida]
MNKTDLLTQQITERVREIITSPQSGYEKRIALFEYLEGLEIGDLQPQEKNRVDCLLQSRLHNELAKKYMKEYKKLTVDNFIAATLQEIGF